MIILFMYVGMHALAPVWRSEDDLRELVLSTVSVLGIKLRMLVSAAGALIL